MRSALEVSLVLISLPYGHGTLQSELDIPGARLAISSPPETKGASVQEALQTPIGSSRLQALARYGQSVAIVTSDITRPCPSHLLLPPILAELSSAGVRQRDIALVFGVGIHRPHTEEEHRRLAGPELCDRLRCIDSDPGRTVFVGNTSRGTPIDVFSPVMEADVRIVLGNVDLHYFAGCSGGAKAILPGVSSERSIRHNHAMMVHPMARGGVLEGNPVREDIEEAGARVGIHFMLNVVLDAQKRILAAFAGHPQMAHREAFSFLRQCSACDLDEPADIVIASAGGVPKDINFYQAHKALESAALLVRPGGIIILVAECAEGFGHPVFEKWLQEYSSTEVLTRIQEQFVLGAHKAAAIARILQRTNGISLVSALPGSVVRRCGMRPFPDIISAFLAAQDKLGQTASVAVMPEGRMLLPSFSHPL
jgi:nickel-dependent lactate racemase